MFFSSSQEADSKLQHTIIHEGNRPTKRELTCWLSDDEFIYPLHVGVNTLGRSSDNDVVLEDAFCSRRHCAILVHSTDSAELHDTASKNGTIVNGRRITGPTTSNAGTNPHLRASVSLSHSFRRTERPAP